MPLSLGSLAKPLMMLLVWLLLSTTGVSRQPGEEAAPESVRSTQATRTRPLPLLPAGITLGTTLFGSADLAALNDTARTRLETAAAGDLRGFTLYLDWPDLESDPGILDRDALLNRLGPLAELGLRVFVNVTVGDIGQYNVPADLSDGDGGLAEGMQLNDPRLVGRFLALLDEMVPLLVEHGVFVLGLGNEMDERLDGAPDELAAYAEFVASARAHVQSLRPELPVAVTLTATSVRRQTSTWEVMRQVADHVAINYGPINPDWRVPGIDQLAADFEQVLDVLGDAPLLVQELSCPSAASMDASLWWQAQCFAILLDSLRQRRQTRFVSVFTLEDLDDGNCQAVRAAFAPLLVDEPDDFRIRFFDYLCKLGLLRADGQPKPAWDIALGRAADLPDRDSRLRALRQRPSLARQRLTATVVPAGNREIVLPLTGSNGEQRRYRVHLPHQKPPISGWPVVLYFHGGGGNAESARTQTRWDEKADQENFVVVFAEGTRPDPSSPPSFSGNAQTWNDGTDRLAIGAIERGEDDVAYALAVLDDLVKRVPVERDRVYVTGFSNGASMGLHLARRAPARLAAVAAVAGKDVDEPLPDAEQLPAMLYMTGTEDPLNPVEGGNIFLFGRFMGYSPPIDHLIERWQTGLSCETASSRIPIHDPEIAAERYFPCRGNATVELWRLNGHGHHWPGGDSPLPVAPWTGPNRSSLDATSTIWQFFVASQRLR